MIRYKRDVSYNAQWKGVTGIKLARIRKEKGLSQEKLSEVSGVSRVTIARFETGVSSPKLQTLKRLADALKVPIDELIDREAG